jgi:hypothetical protein
MPGDEIPLGDDQKPTETPAATAAGVSPEDLNRFKESFKTEIEQSLGSFGERLVASLQQKPTGDPTPQVPDDANDLLQKLMADPKGVIKEIGAEQLKEQLGGYLQTDITDKYTAEVRRHRDLFDGEFGTGAFDEHIFPELDNVFSRLPAQTKASADHVAEAINSIKGRKFGDLTKVKSDHAKALEEAVKQKEAEQHIPVMLANGLPAPRPGRLSANEEAEIAKYVHATGQELDTPALVKFRDSMPTDRGMTLSDYRALQPKEAEK